MSKRLVFLRILAGIQILMVALVALVASFADGGQWWERLVLGVLQPVAAILILALVMQAAPSVRLVKAATAALAIQVVGSASVSLTIITGVTKGDWFLPLVFAVVPLVFLSYCYHRLRG